VALGAHDDDSLSSLAGRLARLDRTLSDADRFNVNAVTHDRSLSDLANALLDAIDPDKPIELATARSGGGDPTSDQIMQARSDLIEQAVRPFDEPRLRNLLIEIQARNEQTIDRVSVDVVREAGFSAADTDRARATVESFQQFIAQHRDEITALQLIYARPYDGRRVTYRQIKELADVLHQPPQSWTTEGLWQAYAQLERDRVRGAGATRVLSDLVALVRHAVQLDDELIPYPDQVQARYDSWVQAQAAAGQTFSAEQRWWLDHIVAHIGVNLSVTADDLT